MADTDEKKEQEDAQDKPEVPQEQSGDEKSLKRSLLPWIIPAVVVVFCAVTGFGLGRIFAGSGGEEPVGASTAGPNQTEDIESVVPDLTGNDSQKTWYFDLDPVVANLDEPEVTRYIRVALTLQVSSEVDQKKGEGFLSNKMPLLTNWLTIYLAGLSIEDIRGDKNLKRVQSQICDVINEKLFPDAKPQIKSILFREFAIQ